MKRYDVINKLIEHHGCKSYLEIGSWMGECFRKVRCKLKNSVDPGDKPITVEGCVGEWAPVRKQLAAGVSYDPPSYRMTSDEFFEFLSHAHPDLKYDFIFIDGCHTFRQSNIDFVNALACLNPGGVIMLHDTLPAHEKHAREDGQNNGEVWKTVARLRCEFTGLNIYTVGVDSGCTVITQDESKEEALYEVLFYKVANWKYFEQFQVGLMNIVSEMEFEIMMMKKEHLR